MPDGLIVALGGHVLLPPGQPPGVAAQRTNLRRALCFLGEIAASGSPIAIVHGNGPQVGHALIRSEAALETAYELPLDVCVAQTQGEIGYLIQEALEDVLRRTAIDRHVIGVITRSRVDASNGARGPLKPIGPFYAAPPARSFPVMADAGRGHRRAVPSPRPLEIVEAPILRMLFEQGVVLVAAGGGGIPVRRRPDGGLTGVEAVVDKDWAASLLALALGARSILDLTGADCVKLSLGGASERDLRRLTPAEARHHLDAGEFAEGSMRPKIEAALHFVEHGGGAVIITSPERAREALKGNAGTRIAARD